MGHRHEMTSYVAVMGRRHELAVEAISELVSDTAGVDWLLSTELDFDVILPPDFDLLLGRPSRMAESNQTRLKTTHSGTSEVDIALAPASSFPV